MILIRISDAHRLDLLEEEVTQGGKEVLVNDIGEKMNQEANNSCNNSNGGVQKSSGIPKRKVKLPQMAMTSPNFKTRHPRARTSSEKAEENDMVFTFSAVTTSLTKLKPEINFFQVMPLPVFPNTKKWKSCNNVETSRDILGRQ